MTPTELRADIPGLADVAYFNYGAHGPSPTAVVEAADTVTRNHEFHPGRTDPYEYAFETYEKARERIASLLGVSPTSVGLTESTTTGINAIATAIEWEPGDCIVRTDVEHPAGILPWERLEREGVEVRVLETTEGRVDLDAYATAVEDAKLVCFSALTWTHGTRLPVAELATIAREHGTLSLVDAVQFPGQARMDISDWNADFVAAAGHKWLLGLWGAGFLYVAPHLADELAPRWVGYRSVETPVTSPFVYLPGARRFEVGSASPAPFGAIVEAIEVIERIGLKKIESRILSLASRLIASIPDDRLLSPASPESGLVTIDVEDPPAAVEQLADAGFVIRDLPDPAAIRISVHAVNTTEEVDRLASELNTLW